MLSSIFVVIIVRVLEISGNKIDIDDDLTVMEREMQTLRRIRKRGKM